MSKPIQHGIMRIDENVDLLHKALNRIKIDISDIKSELKQIKSSIEENKKQLEFDKSCNEKKPENDFWWWT